MKTRAEVEQIKTRWLEIGLWDIESTEGIHEYYGNELEEFSEKHNNIFKKPDEISKIDEKSRLVIKSEQLKCSIETLIYLEKLEFYIEKLCSDIEELQSCQKS
jgi:hypothetical protein